MRQIALAVLLVLAGCTTREASRVAGDPTLEPIDTPELGRHNEDADGWFLRSISEDGMTLGILYTISGVASGCEKEGDSYAEESDDQVVVHAVKSVIDGRNVPCTEELAYVETTVRLKQPLSDRMLLGCPQTRERDEFPEEFESNEEEDRFCRDRTRDDPFIPPSPYQTD